MRHGRGFPLWTAIEERRQALGWSRRGLARMTAHHTGTGEPIPERAIDALRTDRRVPPPGVVFALADTLGLDRDEAAALAGVRRQAVPVAPERTVGAEDLLPVVEDLQRAVASLVDLLGKS
jgi:hypothetical protein